MTWWAYKMSSPIFFLKQNKRNLFIIFLKAKDYHSFPGTYDFIMCKLPDMFVLQTLWENNSDFSRPFLYSEWQQDYGKEIHKFDLNPMMDGQSLGVRKKLLEKTKTAFQMRRPNFFSSPNGNLRPLLNQAPQECQLHFSQCYQWATTYKDSQRFVSNTAYGIVPDNVNIRGAVYGWVRETKSKWLLEKSINAYKPTVPPEIP